MTEQEFINQIEGSINDAWDGASTREEAMSGMMKLFFGQLEKVIQSREHLELFIYRVKNMRDLQEKYFKSNHSKRILSESITAEKAVDAAVSKMLGDLGYSIDKHLKKTEQQNLFRTS